MSMRKPDVVELIHAVSFVVGGTDDPDLDLKVAIKDEPMGNIPAWDPKRGVKYLNIWKDIKFDQLGESGVARLLIIKRINKGTYSKARYFQVNDYGIFEFSPHKEKKELMKVTKTAEGRVKKEERITTGPFDHRWEVVNQWPFYCQECGREKRLCVCDQVYLLTHLSIFQGDSEQVQQTCPDCHKPLVPELYEWESEQEGFQPMAEVMWLCEDCGSNTGVETEMAERVHRLYGGIDNGDGEEENSDDVQV